MIKPYPLQWPIGYPRMSHPTYARFKTTFAQARSFLLDELRRLNTTDVIISCSMKIYGEVPRSRMEEKGVAVYFKLNGNDTVLCCDKWDKIEHNLYAIGLTVEAMRGMDRWGCSDMIKRMFTGFEALPQEAEFHPHRELEIEETASQDEIKAAWRRLMLVYHPDKGGDKDRYDRINRAYQQLKN